MSGQGVETQHDVWREMDYRALDAIRIREASPLGGRGGIVADLAAAYAKPAGVKSYTRSFTWNGGSTLTVTDAVSFDAPRAAEWHLQSDTAFAGSGTRFNNGTQDGPRLQVSFTAPQDLAVTTGRATVKAPGPPGSIEKGTEEQRGYALTATTRAAVAIRVEVTLEVLGKDDLP